MRVINYREFWLLAQAYTGVIDRCRRVVSLVCQYDASLLFFSAEVSAALAFGFKKRGRLPDLKAA